MVTKINRLIQVCSSSSTTEFNEIWWQARVANIVLWYCDAATFLREQKQRDTPQCEATWRRFQAALLAFLVAAKTGYRAALPFAEWQASLPPA